MTYTTPLRSFLIFACLLFCINRPTVCGQAPQSPFRHFIIEKLTSGVFAAIHHVGGYAICNAGIIDLGDATMVIDPFLSPAAAEELKRAAVELTGKPVKFVVNTHYHSDHIRGNQAFQDATIISTEKTYELIRKLGVEEIDEDRKNAALRLESWREKKVDAKDEFAVQEQLGMIGYYEGIVQSLPDIRLTLPKVTFNRSLSIHGSERSVEIIDMGEGHTASDAVVLIDSEHILFAGDLLFVNTQPWMMDGNPENWFRILDRIVDMKPEVIIPGHGPVSNTEAIAPMKSYMRTVLDAASKLAASPSKEIKCPPPYDRWMLSFFYTPNVLGLSKKKGKQEPGSIKRQ